MAKDPAFLFYPNDWIGGTMGMTFEEKGAYMELLMMQFNRGHMTEHMIGQTIGQIWVKLKDKFSIDSDGLYYNERLEIEKEARKKWTASRRNNLSGNNQHTKKEAHKTIHKDGHMTNHMEDVNEDISNSIKVNNIEERKQKFADTLKPFIEKYGNEMIFGVPGFFEYWTEHGPTDKKFRSEKETTWNTEKRLARWERNNKNKGFSKPNTSRALPPGMA